MIITIRLHRLDTRAKILAALKNPRHEAFCRAIVAQLAGKYESQAAAYVAAGYGTKPGNSSESAASRLLSKVKGISERISELQAQAAKRKKVTAETIVDELEQAREIARDERQAGAMVQASAAKAKVLGLQVDRVEQGKPGDFANAKDQQALARSLLRNAGMDEESIGTEGCDAALRALSEFQAAIAQIARQGDESTH